jgi:GABA(A) receptor-associated protein
MVKKRVSEFEKNVPFEKRLSEATKIIEKYPDRIPVIVERLRDKSSLPEIDNKKFLVPSDMTFSQLMYVIRKSIKLSPEKAIFFMVNDVLPPNSALMSQIYEEHKSLCKFLIIYYDTENTFG